MRVTRHIFLFFAILSSSSAFGQPIASLKVVQFSEIAAMFYSSPGETVKWSIGADAKSPIKWETSGVSDDCGEGEFSDSGCRTGYVRIKLGKDELTNLRRNLEPVKWEIRILSKSDPKWGPDLVEIEPQCDTVQCEFNAIKLLRAAGHKLHKLCHAGGVANYQTAFLVSTRNKSAVLINTFSTGSAGTNNVVRLYFTHSEPADSYCKEAKEW